MCLIVAKAFSARASCKKRDAFFLLNCGPGSTSNHSAAFFYECIGSQNEEVNQAEHLLIQCPDEGELKQMAKIAAIMRQLKKEHDRLSKQIRGVAAALSAFGTAYGRQTGRRRLSAAARARIAAAQRARWAKARQSGGQKQNVVRMPKKRTMSASARKRIAAAQRARWAKVKAQKKLA